MRALILLSSTVVFASIALATHLSSPSQAIPSNSGEIIHHSSAEFRAAGYPFSKAVEVDGWVILSGQLGSLPGAKSLAPGGIEGESVQAMENIKAALADLDLTMDRIVKCTVMIDDMADWPAFNSVYKSYFPGGNYPARSAFGADGLALGAKVEVECWARR